MSNQGRGYNLNSYDIINESKKRQNENEKEGFAICFHNSNFNSLFSLPFICKLDINIENVTESCINLTSNEENKWMVEFYFNSMGK